jgi:hypothetical protein
VLDPSSVCARILVVALLLPACVRPERPTSAPSRAPVVPPNDRSWARLPRACPNDAPVRLAPQRPAPAPAQVRSRDYHTAELSREVPGGFGGLFIDYDPPTPPGTERRLETRHVVVLLVDTTQRDAALRALESPTRPDRLPLNVIGARTRPARWSFAELYDWYDLLLTTLGAREGVITTGIDEKENRIVFGVENASGRERLERQLARLDLPCFLVGVRLEGPPVLR